MFTTFITDYLVYFNETLQGLIHRCPYQGAFFNVSFSSANQLKTNRFIFPNGDLQAFVHIYNNRDKNILSFYFMWTRHLV